MNKNIFLDMDGVLTDFIGGAIKTLNARYKTDHTISSYCREYGKYDMEKHWGISVKDFWWALDSNYSFWYDLEPMPWAVPLYMRLQEFGTVTIVTSPSESVNCASQKMAWLRDKMGIKSESVIIGSRKYLLAGNGVLIDDYAPNVKKFIDAGGQGFVLPSNWNTPNIRFEYLLDIIAHYLKPTPQP
jgi:5'(3')-deoxyribonucleotidase